ncbi:MAG TPA: hypothetical protein VN936_04505, partial [Candidatus Acidoferrum sp.]|nr:hypothetical protein [Candidatus Acidoferrum sp.]
MRDTLEFLIEGSPFFFVAAVVTAVVVIGRRKRWTWFERNRARQDSNLASKFKMAASIFTASLVYGLLMALGSVIAA